MDMEIKPLHAFRNSGASAREWKGRIALLAKRGKETLRTLQFPLDIPADELKHLPLDDLRASYNAIEGTGPGTLFDYWAKLHLAGFRFFPAAGPATIFRQQAIFGDGEWNKAFFSQSGHDWPWFVPSKIYERFTKAPREVKKKDGSIKSVDFTPENVANECHVVLAGVSLTDKTPPEQRTFFEGLGAALADHFDSWKAANADPAEACGVVDAYLKEQGLKLHSLRTMAMKCGPTKPEYATIAWHDSPHPGCKNTAPAVFARVASRYGKTPDSGIAKFVQEHATTPNVTALSWLFGSGLDYFRTADLDTILADFGAPAGARAAMQSVKDAALALPPVNVFGKKNHATFRPTFGGKIDSWIANYGKRLTVLNDLLGLIEPGFTLPDALYGNETLMSGLDMNEAELRELIQAVYDHADAAKTAVGVLLGTAGNIDAAILQYETFSGLLDTLHGTLQTIAARYERAVDIAGKDEARLENLVACKFAIPKWCAPMPKIVSISGGLPDVAKEIEEANGKFFEARSRMHARFNEVVAYVESQGGKVDVYATLEQRELAHLKKLKMETPERAHIQARRAVLHRIGRTIQNCSEPTKQKFCAAVKDTGVFRNASHLNTFIFNQKGAIYRSPFDRARNQQYRMDAGVLLQVDWMDLSNRLGAELMEDPSVHSKEDALRLERTLLQLHLSGIPAIDYLSTPDVEVEISPALAMQMSKPTVTADVLQRAFNLYTAVLSGLTFKLLRTAFTVKMRFSLADDTQLIYASKDREWNIPQLYLSAEGDIGIAARAVTPGSKPADMVTQVADTTPEALGAFMRQAPHDWYYNPVMAGGNVTGRCVVKGDVARARQQAGYRLIGAPSFKSVLDKSLVGLADIGRVSVIVELSYTQTVGEDMHAAVAAGEPRVVVSIPVTERVTTTEKDASLLFDRFVAIDLGERGLGYAVFDAKTLDLIESGHRKVPAIANLVRRTRHYEQRPNERQKFQAKFNVNLSELRENTVGDVCHQINRFCAYYRAFPVMEFAVVDSKLNKQVRSVYDAVIHRYVWSSTDAHKTARVQFWLGGEAWEHPILKAAKDKKPLVLSPGRGVPSKGTSQRCSCCGRNPFDLFADLKDTAKVAVVEGKVNLGGSELALFERARETKQDVAPRRRRNLRPAMNQPLTPGTYTVQEIRSVLRDNLRRPPR